METIIEEGIYDVETRLPIRRAIFTFDGGKITRNLFILGDSERRNSKIDVIDIENAKISINVSKINDCSIEEIISFLKKEAKKWEPIPIFEQNVKDEIYWFSNPIITKK